MKVDEFTQKHPPHAPRINPRDADETKKLMGSDGVLTLSAPPAQAQEKKVPASKGDPGCHLWIIDESGLPYILEHAEVAQTLRTGLVKHTNLTGGEAASSGGELWVDPADASRLYVNGCSGRYGPSSRDELEDVVEVFEQMGFDVTSFGWDDDAGRPAMVLRDD
jgi:hypothetical protein